MKTSSICIGLFVPLIFVMHGCLPADEEECNLSVTATASGSSIYVVVSNGIQPYGYGWSNGSVADHLESLVPGIYWVTVTDVNGCTASDSATVASSGNACSVSTVTDVDGNVYSTVSIGNQCWLAPNLKTTRYRDGTPIPNVADATDWSYLATGAYCDYENDAGNSATYGRLYNWYAVNTGNVCPVGWHVPSDAEWTALATALGDEILAGGKLKEAGLTHWQSPNAAATNETNFTALPGGSRFSTGSFYNITYDGYFWTTTTGTDPAYAWYHWLDFNSGFLIRSEDYKTDGASVRCVKD